MKIIDMNASPRRDAFNLFSGKDDPFYALTCAVEVTALRAYAKAHGLSFYMCMVYQLTQALNSVPNMRYDFQNGQVVELDARVPSFTDLRPGEECFHIVSIPVQGDMDTWAREAKAASLAQTEFIDMSKENSDLFFVSCMPWMTITAVTDSFTHDKDDGIPRFSWGKWEEKDGRTFLNLSCEVNHRLVDGLHVGQMVMTLEKNIRALAVS